MAKSINYKRCLILFALGILNLTSSFGQCPFPILTGASTSGNARAPIGTFRFERGHYLITAAEMAAAGYLPGTINSVRWAYTVGNSISVTGNLAVYFENTADVTNLKSTTWATAVGTMTNSRPSSSFTLPATPTLTYDVPITTPFTYTGGGLYVAYEWSNAANPLAAAGATVTCNTALNLSLSSAQSNVALPTATGAFSAFRPITTFFGPTPPNNDIKVDLIYSFGKLANGHSTNHPVRARILNVGNATQTSIPVTLNVSGLTTFSDVQTIASLAPCTGTTVTFNSYTPVGTGTNTVSVSVPSDDNNANNSKSLTQDVTTQEIAYKDVSQTNSGGVGFTGGTGAFVGKFNTATGGQINEVQVDFTSSGFTYRVGIYGDNAGVPGTLLYTDAVDRTSSPGTAFITLSPTVTVPAGNFYIGIRQTGTNNIGFAFTTESPLRSGDFFYTSPLPEINPWTELSGTGLTFRFNIQAKFYIPAPPSCAASQSPADLSTNNCLNSVLSWASGGGGPIGYKVTFGTNAPNYDNVLNNVDLGNVLTYNPGTLAPATTYGYKIVPYNADGDAVGCTFNTFTTTASGALPFTEDFSSIIFPPTCWTNSDPAVIFRSTASAYGAGSGSTVFDFYNAAVGNYDLTSPIFGNTPAGHVLSFDYAYATFISEVDQLEIFYSTNQGASFTSLVLLNGGPTGILNTGGANTAQFVPSSGQWGTYQILLPTGTNMIRFRGISAFGNDLYLDNISIAAPVVPNCPVSHSPLNAATNQFRDLSLSWQNGGGASSYDVYFDLGAGPATTLVSASQASTSYTPAPLAANTQYSWRVVAKNLAGDAVGCSDLTFTTGTEYDYCFPAHFGCGNGDVTNVTLNTLNSTSTCNPPAYQNFPATGSTTTTVDLNNSYNLSVTTDQSCIISVWFDWNHNGVFEASEWTQVTTSSTANVASTVSISVPPTASLGMTGLRIRSRLVGNTNGATDACLSMGSGEAEDYYVTIGGCATTASSNAPVCENSLLSVSSSFVSLGTPVSYSWTTTALNGFTSSSANATVSANANPTNDAGTYSVTITDNNGCTSSGSVVVGINPSPQPQIGGGNATEEVCQGLPLAFSANNLAGGQTSSYSWSTNAANGYTSNQQNVSVTNSSSPAQDNGTYTVTIQNQFLCTASASVIATVNPNPSVSIQSTVGVGCSTLPICDGSMVVLASGGTPPYQLYDDGNSNLNGDGNFNGVMCYGSGTVTVTDDKGCEGTSPYTIGAISTTAPTASVLVPPINNLPAFACNGTLVNNINVPTVAGATKYNWDGPSGTDFNGAGSTYTNSSPNANITFGPLAVGASGYYIGVQAANGCGTSLRKVQWVRGTLSIPTVSGPSVVCAGGSGSYSVTNAPIGGAQSYTWSGPAGTTFNGNPTPYTSANTSVTATLPIGFTSGSICVTANAACISTAPKCISVSTAPATLGVLSGVFSVCPPAIQNYSVSNPGVVGGTYNWTLPANASGSSTTDNINVSFAAGFTGGNISVTYTNVCSQTSAVRLKTITIGTPTVPSSISTTTTNGLCGQAASFTCPPQAGASFNWTFPAGSTPASITAGSNSVGSTMPGAPFSTGQVCVTATNGCGTSGPRCITVKGAPLTPGSITPNPASWCAPASGIQFSADISALTGVYSLNWVVTPAGRATYVSGQATNNYTVDWDNAGTASVILTASNACGNASSTLALNVASCSRIAEGNVVSTSDDRFTVYPNPSSTLLNFEFNSNVSQNVEVSLMDLSGRAVIATTVGATEGFNSGKIDVSKLAKGVYTFKATSAESTSTVRIVVD